MYIALTFLYFVSVYNADGSRSNGGIGVDCSPNMNLLTTVTTTTSSTTSTTTTTTTTTTKPITTTSQATTKGKTSTITTGTGIVFYMYIPCIFTRIKRIKAEVFDEYIDIFIMTYVHRLKHILDIVIVTNSYKFIIGKICCKMFQ